MTTVALCRALYKAHAADPAHHVGHTARLSIPYSTVNLHEDDPTTVDVKKAFGHGQTSTKKTSMSYALHVCLIGDFYPV